MNIGLDRRLFLIVGLVVMLLLGLAVTGGKAEAGMTSEQCLSCHSNEHSPVYVDQDLLAESVHSTFSCTTCHGQVTTFPHLGEVSNSALACTTCHAEASREYEKSVHGRQFAAGNEALGCNSCHGSHNVLPGSNPDSPVNRLKIPATCAGCHDGSVPVNSYAESFHGIANKFGSDRTAQCADCHGTHNILEPGNPNSMVAKTNVPETCARCHNIAQPNFSAGPEHFVKKPTGDGAPMYWTLKFFTWLTIITITLLVIHIELELFKRLREIKS